MKKKLLLLGFLPFAFSAQNNPGDLAFVAYNADSLDGFSIVLLVDFPGDSLVYFSDNEWNEQPIGAGGNFINSSEGELTWQVASAGLVAGTTVNFTAINDDHSVNYGSDGGQLTGTINLNAVDEVLYAFRGNSDTQPTNFLAAIASDEFNSSKGSLVNTGLVKDSTAIAFSDDEDVMVFNQSTFCDSTPVACLARINNPANWITEDGTGDQSQNGAAPDFPDDSPRNFSGAALPILVENWSLIQDERVITCSWNMPPQFTNCVQLEMYSNSKKWEEIPFTCINGNCSFSVTTNSDKTCFRLNETCLQLTPKIEAQACKDTRVKMPLPYPNPATDYLVVPFNEAWQIYDVHGHLVSDSSRTNSGVVDTSKWKKGVYFITSKALKFKVLIL